MTRIAIRITSGFGQKRSATATAMAITAKSCNTAAVARQGERRVSAWTTSLGRALRKSSLNSSPLTLLVDPADQDVLHLQVLLEAVFRAFAAEARLLHAAERRDFGRDDADVRADDPRLHRFGHVEDAAHIAAVKVSRKAEFARVGEPDDLVLGLETDERRHRAEGLLVGHEHLRRDVREDGRLEEKAAALVLLAAERHFGAFAEGVGDVRLDFLQPLLVDERADDDAGLVPRADLEPLDLLGELRGECFINPVLHVDAVGANAGLSGVAVFGRE